MGKSLSFGKIMNAVQEAFGFATVLGLGYEKLSFHGVCNWLSNMFR